LGEGEGGKERREERVEERREKEERGKCAFYFLRQFVY